MISLKYFHVFATLLFTIYGQIVLKWRINHLDWKPSTDSVWLAVVGYVKFLFDPFIFSGFLSAFIASIFWMLAMTKLEITEAYPFMTLAPALIFVFGVLLLNETFTWGKVIGLCFIIVGIIITVK